MNDISIEELIERTASSYDLVVVVAKRAIQIKRGAKPLVSIDSNNPVTIALAEIAADKIIFQPSSEAPEEQPEAPIERDYLTRRGDIKKLIAESE